MSGVGTVRTSVRRAETAGSVLVSCEERPLRVAGLGMHLPATVETAEDLAPRIGRSAEWQRTRTGVGARHIAGLPLPEMAAAAVRDALGGGPRPDLLINASLSPHQLAPDGAALALRALGWAGTPGFSIHATCLSFLAAVPVAAGMLNGGGARRVVVVSAEAGSRCRDFSEPESATLIGDAAAAAVFERCEPGGPALLGHACGTWPAGVEAARIEGFGARRFPGDPDTEPGHQLFTMRGPSIYKLARRRVPELLDALLGGLGLQRGELDLVVPHQASGPGLRMLERLGFSSERVVRTLSWSGNCIAASIPLALAHAAREGRLEPGMRVLLLGTGAGLSASAVVLRW